jgi:YggT family protein
MLILGKVYWLISTAIIGVTVAMIVLIVLRMIANKADLNPFAWTSLTIRRLTDPVIGPVRRSLMAFHVDPKYASLVAILLTILLGWFALQLVASVANTLAGILLSLSRHAAAPLAGYVLYGLLSLYALLIFVRMIFSFVRMMYSGRVMRFIVKATDPLLVPLRGIIRPLGAFDISPFIAFLIVWVLQAAVAGTLLSGWQIRFFG